MVLNMTDFIISLCIQTIRYVVPDRRYIYYK